MKLNRVSNETAADGNNKNYLIPLLLSLHSLRPLFIDFRENFETLRESIFERINFSRRNKRRDGNKYLFRRLLRFPPSGRCEIEGAFSSLCFSAENGETLARCQSVGLFAISSPSLAKFLPTKRGVVSNVDLPTCFIQC